ncbi:MAG: hypothetical protein ABSE45_15530 [Candidatus Acidiferrales bacterium]|jgi:hypothetical protein
MSEAGEIAQWIQDLANPDLSQRIASATRLHLAGSALCLSATSEWAKDLEFRELVLPFRVDENGQPSSEKTPFVVGVAVWPKDFEKIRAANGHPPLADVPPDQDAIEFELRLLRSKHPDFDILTTRDPHGPGAIARYLQKFGEGIQQVEINVTNVDRATEILRARFGLEPVYPATRPGADGTRVNFFLVSARDRRVLIELVEPGRGLRGKTREAGSSPAAAE